MDRTELAGFENVVATIVETGRMLAAGRRGTRIRRKADGSLVCDGDRVAEERLVMLVRGLFPGEQVVSEESARWESLRPSGGRVWVIDPIDGTANFVVGGFAWAISLGVFESGVPVGGIVFAPEIVDACFVRRPAGELVRRTRSGERAVYREAREEGRRNFICVTESMLRRYTCSDAWAPRTFGSVALNMLEVLCGHAVAAVTEEYIWDIGGVLALGHDFGLRMFDLGGRAWDTLDGLVILPERGEEASERREIGRLRSTLIYCHPKDLRAAREAFLPRRRRARA